MSDDRCSSRYGSWPCDKREGHHGNHHSLNGAREWSTAAATAPRSRVEPVSVSAAHPEDFVRPEPNAVVAHQRAIVADLLTPPKSTEAARDLPDPQTYKRSDTTIVPPYTTPIPTAHDGAVGWVWCATCESPQPVSGHECPPVRREPFSLLVEAAKQQERAEFAESLLCAMAFDSARSNPEFGCNVGLLHHGEDECVMCFEFYGGRAARGGGR